MLLRYISTSHLCFLILLTSTFCLTECVDSAEESRSNDEYSFLSSVTETYESIIRYTEHAVEDFRLHYGVIGDARNSPANNKEDVKNDYVEGRHSKEEKIYDKYSKCNNSPENIVDNLGTQARNYKSTTPDENNDFEYLPEKRLEPGEVGQIQTVNLPDGRAVMMKTLAKRPPLFEIEEFLTEEECDMIIDIAEKEGMDKSGLFINKKSKVNYNISLDRISHSVFLNSSVIGANLLRTIRNRISSITDIPLYVLEGSEHINVVNYKPGGFYHAHLDSTANENTLPCCFQWTCKDDNGTKYEGLDCCKLCRYASFLYYLNDVEGGGETAFPVADKSLSYYMKQKENPNWANLTTHCHNSSVVIKPSKGKAIFWYNHYLDSRGYLGGADWRSHHGGCHVTSGAKWIATNWISFPVYSGRFKPGKYGNLTKSYQKYLHTKI